MTDLYKEGTKILFDYCGISGIGYIVGLSSILPVLGAMYIVRSESNMETETYPYREFFVCPNCYIKMFA